jgi:uncharacterized RDD family membrane protein YckC
VKANAMMSGNVSGRLGVAGGPSLRWTMARIAGLPLLLVILAVALSASSRAAVAQLPGSSTTRAAPSEGPLMLLGDDDQTFAVESARIAGLLGEYRTLIFRRTVKSGTWIPSTEVAGQVTAATLWRGQLALLMEGNSWRICFSDGSTQGPLPPKGVELLDLAGDGQRLMAVAKATGRDPFVLELQGGSWVEGPAFPDHLSPTGSALIGGKLYVCGRVGTSLVVFVGSDVVPKEDSGGAPATSRAATSRAAQASAPTDAATTRPVSIQWGRVHSLDAVPPSAVAELLEVRGEVGLWVHEPGAGGTLYLNIAHFDPAKRIDLGPNTGQVVVAGGRIRYIYNDRARKATYEQAYDLSGKPLGKPEIFAVTQSIADERLRQLIEGLAVAGAMGGILLAWRRRAEMTEAAIAEAGKLALAPWSMRVGSASLDAIPWIAAVAYLVLAEHVGVLDLLSETRTAYVYLVGAAACVMQSLMGELMFGGRSLGKAVFGLRVVTLAGGPVSPGNVLLRNLLKMTALVFPPIWLSVLMSPMRQSVWDAATGTVVVATKTEEERNDER